MRTSPNDPLHKGIGGLSDDQESQQDSGGSVPPRFPLTERARQPSTASANPHLPPLPIYSMCAPVQTHKIGAVKYDTMPSYESISELSYILSALANLESTIKFNAMFLTENYNHSESGLYQSYWSTL